MSTYRINDTTLTGIADAVRNLRHEKSQLTPAQIEAKIRTSRLGVPIVVSNHINQTTGQWERPADWPDIDALAAQIVGDVDCLYLTYDLRKTVGYGWIGVYAKTADDTAWTADRGHVTNGAFVPDETFSTASNAYLSRELDPVNGDVQLWRITSAGHITQIGFTSTGVSGKAFQNNMQPCVQRSGKLPWCDTWAGSIGTSVSVHCGGTMWLEKDAMIPGKLAVVTSLANCWNSCYSLQSIDLSGWDTSGWAVTTLNACWYGCYSLQSLDLSDLDTSGWAVETLASCWAYCCSLQSLDLSGWNTSGWVVTTLANCWAYCYSLQSLDLSGWNTSGWAVTTLAGCWLSCFSLQSLDLSGWNTSEWVVATISGSWYNCYSLQSINLSGWDTSEWVVTTLANCWYGCYSLQSLDISRWDVSEWILTTMANCWSSCYSLRSIKTPASLGLTSDATISTPNLANLEEFTGFSVSANCSYNGALKLTIESLVSIINRLPIISSTKTITLGINKVKLTNEQIAVATQKGWTVA